MAKKQISLLLLTGVLLFGITGCKAPVNGTISKKDAVAEVNGYIRNGRHHSMMLRRMKWVIRTAEANTGFLVHISGLMADLGYHTVPLFEIARDAAHAAPETETLYYDISELALIKLSSSDEVIALSEKLRKADSSDEIAAVRREYEKLYEMADYKTVDEAAVQVKKMTAIAEAEKILASSKQNISALANMTEIIAQADANIDVLVAISELLSKVGFHTNGLLQVAEDAAHAAPGTEELYSDIAELTVLTLSGTQRVLDLSTELKTASTEAEIAAAEAEIDRLYASADCRTIQEAVRTVDKMMRKIEKTVSDM